MNTASIVRGALPCRVGPRPTLLVSLLTLLLALALPLPAQLVVYSFGPSGTPTTAATSVAGDLAASAFTGFAGGATTGAGAPLFSAGSGGSYFSASGWNGPAPGPNYLEFTLTPNSGFEFSVASLSFGYRATASGPTAFAVRSSADAFANNLANGTFLADSTWHGTGALALALAPLEAATTFRIYASGASSALGTLRVDDVALAGSVSAVPEPATWASLLGASALGFAVWRRKRTARPA